MKYYNADRAVPNANKKSRPGLVPLTHLCKCMHCGATYEGHGVECPDCTKKLAEARLLEIANRDAQIEYRIQQARKPLTEMEQT